MPQKPLYSRYDDVIMGVKGGRASSPVLRLRQGLSGAPLCAPITAASIPAVK